MKNDKVSKKEDKGHGLGEPNSIPYMVADVVVITVIIVIGAVIVASKTGGGITGISVVDAVLVIITLLVLDAVKLWVFIVTGAVLKKRTSEYSMAKQEQLQEQLSERFLAALMHRTGKDN